MTLEIDFLKDLIEGEERELGEIPHKVLLEEAFEDLRNEVDANGNSVELERLREEHAKRLARYWRQRYHWYQETGQDVDGQKLDVSYAKGVCNEFILKIKRETLVESDEVTVTYNADGEIDGVHLPTITSKVKTDPEESHHITYKFEVGRDRFQRGGNLRIAEFTRERVYEDPEHQRSWVYDTRTIR